MRKLLSVILMLAMLLSLISCAMGDGTDGSGITGDGTTPADPSINEPEYKDYERGTIDFDKIER